MNDELRRPASPSTESVVAAFDGEGPGAEILKLLENLDRRDLFLNVGYSRFWQRHWTGKAQRRLVDRLARRLLKFSKLDPVLLDVGCGRGGPAIRLRQKWDMDVTGIDLSERNIEMARRKTRDLVIHERLLFRKADAGRLPFQAETFSLVTAIESFEYIRSKRRVMSEIQRVLKPGGAVAVAALLANEPAITASSDHEHIYQDFLAHWDFHDLGSESSFREMLGEVGLRVQRLEDATSRTLRPHHRRLKRFVWLMYNPLFYRIIRRYSRRKFDVDIDPVRIQLKAARDALSAGLVKYGLIWAEKPTA